MKLTHFGFAHHSRGTVRGRMVESRPIDLSLFTGRIRRLRQRHEHIVVEGVGGWRVPITRDFAVSDLAAEMGLPVVVVVANRLGALNHTLLTVESIQAGGLLCAGIVLNQIHRIQILPTWR
jgi:dethiobiotin synthetase